MASKYEHITDVLRAHPTDELLVSLHELDRLVGGLPASAYEHQAWWANEAVGSHVQAKSWMREGWATCHLDLNRKTIIFRRVGNPPAS